MLFISTVFAHSLPTGCSEEPGIIAFFNQHYVKPGIFDKEISKMIDSCYRLREKADYDDFFLAAKDDAVIQLEKAKRIMEAAEQYITSRTAP